MSQQRLAFGGRCSIYSDESDESRPEERVAPTGVAIESEAIAECASGGRAVGLPDSYHHIA